MKKILGICGARKIPVGERFVFFNGGQPMTLKAEIWDGVSHCSECVFCSIGTLCGNAPCCASGRKDKKDVKFVRVVGL